jgi:hypothetical protein
MGRRGVQCTMLGTNHPRSGRECGARAVSAAEANGSFSLWTRQLPGRDGGEPRGLPRSGGC